MVSSPAEHSLRNLLFSVCIWTSTSFFKTSVTANSYNKNTKSNIAIDKKNNKEQWITIFIHGTCGSALSLVSLPKVIIDKTDGSLYQKLQKNLRREHWFLSTDFGINPINLNSNIEYETLAHYVIKAYTTIESSVNNDDTYNNDFYLYGWNGILSKTERLKESIRLYNELSHLITKYEFFGITPKIRLVCYSHGGNLALNLGAIHSIINNNTETEFYNKQTLSYVEELLNQPITPLHDNNPNAQQWYQRPKNANLTIDELILYATPIHQETESLCTAPLFKKVINLYSENDLVQPVDVVTTEFRNCKQILNDRYLASRKNIIQIKIMINRNMPALAEEKKTPKAPLSYRERFAKTQQLVSNFNLKAAMRGGHAITEHHEDLTHTDFWWISHRDPKLFFSPLPFVIFTPVILQALKKASLQKNSIYYFDLNVTEEKKMASFNLYVHDNPTHLVSTQDCPINPINAINRMLIKHKKDMIKQ